MNLSPAYQAKLDTCHSLLRRVFTEVAKRTPTAIICGHRGEKEQEEAYATKRSKLRYPMSKHNTSPSLAVDAGPLMAGHSTNGDTVMVIPWNSPKAWDEFAVVVKAVAAEMNVDLRWGGEFKKLVDKPHWELKI